MPAPVRCGSRCRSGSAAFGFSEHGDCLVVGDLGRLEPAIQSQKVGLAFQGLSQPQLIKRAGVAGAGECLLGLDRLFDIAARPRLYRRRGE